jgi:Lon protease-like protein
MSELLLPLFPLKLVLFPGMNLPLHIFEERYKRMIAQCLKEKSEFGIVLAHEDEETGESGIAAAGCSALVTNVVRQYEDGRMDIIVRGVRRFEVVNLNQDEPCLRGEVLFFDDEEAGDAPPADTRRDQALRLCDEVMRMIPSRDLAAGAELPERDAGQLSYEVVAQLPIALNFRQTLLELRSETARLDELIQHLTQLKGFLAKLTAARVKAGSNGHGRNKSNAAENN